MARTPLAELNDWKLADEHQDIRGWPLVDSAGERVATVRQLIVDTENERVVSIVLDNGAEVPTSDVAIGDQFIRLRRDISEVAGRPPESVRDCDIRVGAYSTERDINPSERGMNPKKGGRLP